MRDVRRMSEEEILKLAQEEAGRSNAEVLQMKKLERPADFYLRYIFAKREKEYVVWLFNVQFGGLSNGNYFSHWHESEEEQYKKALEDYNSKN